mmetsp:Transcript_38944/g.60683  ORF Transcript_38944/g.60683 Transcript_38944/m.60683 type:complete len:107 (+) Transcript_38944:156-476(+)
MEQSQCSTVKQVVYDVSQYMSMHPGGRGSIMRHAGRDASADFVNRHQSLMNAWNKLPDLYVADIQSGMMAAIRPTSSGSRANAYVLKDTGADAQEEKGCVIVCAVM